MVIGSKLALAPTRGTLCASCGCQCPGEAEYGVEYFLFWIRNAAFLPQAKEKIEVTDSMV
jgi:hypothetical protein